MSGLFRASLVLVVGIDPDGSYVLACGHRKRLGATTFRPRRTQCRECFPHAPLPGGWWSTAKRARALEVETRADSVKAR